MIYHLAKRVFKKYRPKIILLSKDEGEMRARACFFILKQKFRTRIARQDIAFAFLSKERSRSFLSSARARLSGVLLFIFRASDYPEVMIIAASAKDVEETRAPFLLYDVYAYVVHDTYAKMSRNTLLIVNGDEPETETKNLSRVISYGIIDPRVLVKGEEAREIERDKIRGLYMKLLYQGTATPIFIAGSKMEDAATLISAAAVGVAFQLTPLEIARGLEEFGISSFA